MVHRQETITVMKKFNARRKLKAAVHTALLVTKKSSLFSEWCVALSLSLSLSLPPSHNVSYSAFITLSVAARKEPEPMVTLQEDEPDEPGKYM